MFTLVILASYAMFIQSVGFCFLLIDLTNPPTELSASPHLSSMLALGENYKCLSQQFQKFS